MSAYGTRDIRSWEWTVLDQLALQEIRETGYLGNLWGADFYVSDQVAYGTMYIMTSPKFLAWMPFRRDTQVIPADRVIVLYNSDVISESDELQEHLQCRQLAA